MKRFKQRLTLKGRWFLLLLLGSILLSNCSQKKRQENEIIKKLTGGKVKYWDLVQTTDTDYIDEPHKLITQKLTKIMSCAEFNVNGKHLYLDYDRQGKRVIFPTDDIVYPNTWKYISDSTIEIEGGIWKINKLTVDTLSISLKEYNTTYVYVKSK